MLQWEGCTDSDVEAVARAHDLDRLPEIYAEWMRRRGRGPGRPSRFHAQGGTVYFPEAAELHTDALEIVAGMPTSFRLPENALVVSAWQGYMFEYVLVDAANATDPVLLAFIEGAEEPQPRGRLSKWLTDLTHQERPHPRRS